jgi:hypothetical protein
LRRAGLVRAARRGTFSEYSLVCGCVTHLVDCIEEGMDEAPSGACPKGRPRSAHRCSPLP